jgi:hypothetical protein
MSRIEKLVTSLDVSRKLKALGIIQESCFYWVCPGFRTDSELWIKSHGKYYSLSDIGGMPMYEPEEKVSAWTVTGLSQIYWHSSMCPEVTATYLIDWLENRKDKGMQVEEMNKKIKEWQNEQD